MAIEREKIRRELQYLIAHLSEEDKRLAIDVAGKNRFEDVEEFLKHLRMYVNLAKEEPDGWGTFGEYLELGGFVSQGTIRKSKHPQTVQLKQPTEEDVKSIYITFSGESKDDLPKGETLFEVTPSGRQKQITPRTAVTNLIGDNTIRYGGGKKVGEGGMGAILQLHDKVFDRPLIRKKPKSTLEEDLQMFEQEMRISGTLVHANIPPIYEAGVDENDGVPYFDMLKIDGMNLEDLISKARKHIASKENDLNYRVKLFADACKAVVYAHSRGVIHRDLKPANIMVGKNNVTYVLDWGLGRFLEEKQNIVPTKQGEVAGTFQFMAPEQAEAEGIDEKSDQFALGAILYELATLHEFRKIDRSKGFRAILVNVADDKYPRPEPRTANPKISPELESIIIKATALDKKERYRTTQQLLDDVEAYLTGDVVKAHTYSMGEKIQRRIAKVTKKGIAAAGITAAAILGIGVYGLMSGRLAETELQAERAEKEKQVAAVKAAEAETEKAKAEAEKNKAEAQLTQTLREQLEKAQKRSKAQEKFWQGEEVLKRGESFEKAIEYFTESIKIDSEWNDPYFRRGQAYYELRIRDKALDDLAKANALSLSENKRIDVRALFTRAMVAIDEADDPKLAGEDLEKIIKNSADKNEPYHLLARSITEFNNGDMRAAINSAQQVTNANKMSEAFYLLSMYNSWGIKSMFNDDRLKEFKDYNKALEYITSAIELDGKHWRYFMHRSLVYNMLAAYDTAKLDLAIHDADKVINGGAFTNTIFYAKAQAQQNKGLLEDALKTLEFGESKIGKLRHDCLALRGVIYLNLKQSDLAVQALESAIEEKEMSQYRVWNGIALQRLERLEQAVQNFDRAIDLDPFPNTYLYRGRCHEQMNNAEKALSDYDKTIELGGPLGYYYKGSLLATQNKVPEAIQALQSFLDTGYKQNRDKAQSLLDQLKKQ